MNLGNVRISDSETQKMVEELTADFNGNRSEMIREAIKSLWLQKHPTANLIFGYVKLDRRGDIDESHECPECGQNLEQPYLWFREDGSFGILCSGCATSD
jgi:hypothetical protein